MTVHITCQQGCDLILPSRGMVAIGLYTSVERSCTFFILWNNSKPKHCWRVHHWISFLFLRQTFQFNLQHHCISFLFLRQTFQFNLQTTIVVLLTGIVTYQQARHMRLVWFSQNNNKPFETQARTPFHNLKEFLISARWRGFCFDVFNILSAEDFCRHHHCKEKRIAIEGPQQRSFMTLKQFIAFSSWQIEIKQRFLLEMSQQNRGLFSVKLSQFNWEI